ncbi:SAM-dependent methyltransferase [Siculibacillus lacustris]|uniref:S-adenosyl-L-methionine-dependent methyltransferase n=1 Tax=Siculibacillus lacustris TaxID=1549641 RepID=A0A4Q9VZ47_9HYPH|nr:class I SAM-dependent methyltransferase [Siculibacillus lacustris]TBW40889.1 SAM-dependent methyltransferase [Siculibacillus lacustris]
MIDGRASRTALGAAVHRILHRRLDRPPIFDDPFAEALLDDEGRALLAARAAEPERSVRLRTTIALRSRLAEDGLAAAIDRGCRQYVLLGAGLDTLALRRPVADLRVFEVDHPATQAWKRQRLAAAGLGGPDGPIFVPVDFERDRLDQRLAEAGFDADAPAVFALLGVVPYVERAALLDTLRYVAARPAGCAEVTFDCSEPWESAAPPIRAAYRALADLAAAEGEPWVTSFTPEDLARDLAAVGFASVEDRGPAVLARVLAGLGSPLRPSPLGHVVTART